MWFTFKRGAQPLSRDIQRGVKAGGKILKGNQSRHFGDGLFRKVALQQAFDIFIHLRRRGGDRFRIGQRRAPSSLNRVEFCQSLTACTLSSAPLRPDAGCWHQYKMRSGRSARPASLVAIAEPGSNAPCAAPDSRQTAPPARKDAAYAPPASGVQHRAEVFFCMAAMGLRLTGRVSMGATRADISFT